MNAIVSRRTSGTSVVLLVLLVGIVVSAGGRVVVTELDVTELVVIELDATGLVVTGLVASELDATGLERAGSVVVVVERVTVLVGASRAVPAVVATGAAPVPGTDVVLACEVPDEAFDPSLHAVPTTASAMSRAGPRRRNTATASRTRALRQSLP